MPQSDDWFQLSLDGDYEGAYAVQGRVSRELRLSAFPQEASPALAREAPEDFLSDKRVPAPPCPGFERLDAIMSIDRLDQDEAKILATHYRRDI